MSVGRVADAGTFGVSDEVGSSPAAGAADRRGEMNTIRRSKRAAAALAGALLVAACSAQASTPPQAAQVSSVAPAPKTTTASPASHSPLTVLPPASAHLSTVQPSTPDSAAATSTATSASPSTSSSNGSASSSGKVKPKPPKPNSATVSASPEFGTEEANPAQPLTVKAAGGTISTLAVYAADGSTINGSFSADRTSWSSDQRLRYGGSYHAEGVATGPAGSDPTIIDGVWTTVDGGYTQITTISPGNGAKVGVAIPIVIGFGTCGADHSAVEPHVSITTTPKVELRGAWIRHDSDDCRSLDVRPEKFWPEGTKVHVAVDLLGVQVAEDVWGSREIATRDFTIGRNQVTYADARTHMITVKQDGKVVASYPTSMGRGDDIHDARMVTRSGIHVVIGKEAEKKMTNEKFGYKDLPEPWSVRISNNGEFIHQNLETMDVQGKQNVSHGCLNLSDVNAKAYFNSAIYGDPVVITGTSVPLSASDGDLYDWAVPWDEWRPLGSEA